ncbi:CD3324 family protein [Saccharibacillus sacchari]|uniref:CD3324 family protein n=1 Tax=Saccharibacillus sacchari TaxID=456493 RepID=A0ACC6PLK5_9BACL
MSEQRNRPYMEKNHEKKLPAQAANTEASKGPAAYRNAAVCLPEELLRQLQRYVGGELLYVPVPAGTKKGWGACSGRREQLEARNADMVRLYGEGVRTEELAERYGLSVERVRRICYGKGLNRGV